MVAEAFTERKKVKGIEKERKIESQIEKIYPKDEKNEVKIWK